MIREILFVPGTESQSPVGDCIFAPKATQRPLVHSQELAPEWGPTTTEQPYSTKGCMMQETQKREAIYSWTTIQQSLQVSHGFICESTRLRETYV